MVTVDVLEAETALLDLLVKVEAGEDVIIARDGTPVALLTRPKKIRRTPGLFAGEPDWKDYDPSIWGPYTDEELAEVGWPV